MSGKMAAAVYSKSGINSKFSLRSDFINAVVAWEAQTLVRVVHLWTVLELFKFYYSERALICSCTLDLRLITYTEFSVDTQVVLRQFLNLWHGIVVTLQTNMPNLRSLLKMDSTKWTEYRKMCVFDTKNDICSVFLSVGLLLLHACNIDVLF